MDCQKNLSSWNMEILKPGTTNMKKGAQALRRCRQGEHTNGNATKHEHSFCFPPSSSPHHALNSNSQFLLTFVFLFICLVIVSSSPSLHSLSLIHPVHMLTFLFLSLSMFFPIRVSIPVTYTCQFPFKHTNVNNILKVNMCACV